jgi:hypothetical protein
MFDLITMSDLDLIGLTPDDTSGGCCLIPEKVSLLILLGGVEISFLALTID